LMCECHFRDQCEAYNRSVDLAHGCANKHKPDSSCDHGWIDTA
jgi:hypothetical protein